MDASKYPMQSVCIQTNPAVIVSEFLPVLEAGFQRHGIATSVYDGNEPADCEYVLTYTAKQSWDITTYLNYVELWLKKGGKMIATVKYKHGSASFSKWRSVERKITPILDEFLEQFAETGGS